MRALGLTLLLAATIPAAAASGPPAKLTLATWNVAWLSDDGSGAIRRSDADYSRLAGYAARLKADVVALQEVDGETAAARLLTPTKWEFHFEGGNRRQRVGIAVRRGLKVRRHPDVESLDVGGLRSGVHVEIRTRAGSLHVLAVHLKAGCHTGSLRRSGKACGKLRRQLVALEQWIDARAAAGDAFVVLGDFNRRLDGADPFWREIDDGDPPGARLTAPARDRRSRCWSFEHYIDHVVLGRRAAGWLVDGSFRQQVYDSADAKRRRALSDHCPVLVTLQPR